MELINASNTKTPTLTASNDVTLLSSHSIDSGEEAVSTELAQCKMFYYLVDPTAPGRVEPDARYPSLPMTLPTYHPPSLPPTLPPSLPTVITSHHNTSHHIISHHIISHHVTSYYITSHHITSCHIILYHIISYHIMSHHIISRHIMSLTERPLSNAALPLYTPSTHLVSRQSNSTFTIIPIHLSISLSPFLSLFLSSFLFFSILAEPMQRQCLATHGTC